MTRIYRKYFGWLSILFIWRARLADVGFLILFVITTNFDIGKGVECLQVDMSRYFKWPGTDSRTCIEYY